MEKSKQKIANFKYYLLKNGLHNDTIYFKIKYKYYIINFRKIIRSFINNI